jgi:hypothetical protein
VLRWVVVTKDKSVALWDIGVLSLMGIKLLQPLVEELVPNKGPKRQSAFFMPHSPEIMHPH